MTNVQKIQNQLSTKQLDAIMLITPVNRQYAVGFHSSDGAVVITKDKAYYFVDSRYFEAAHDKVKVADVYLSDDKMRMSDWIKKTISDCNIKSLGAEEDGLSHSEYLNYEEKLGIFLIPAQSILKDLRASKNPEELENLKAAQAIAEKAFDDILGIIKPGMTEKEVAAELTYRMMKYGGEGNSFDPIVVTGKKTSMPHGTPGDVKIQEGDFLTMDFGCIYNGYCSDMTRTVAIGHVDDEMRKVYEIVLEAQLAGIQVAKAGVVGKEIDAAARKVIVDAGYGQYFGHGFGHSLGLEIHESPNANTSEIREMPVGAVISAEPGIYLPGKFGVRIEDVLYLTENGCEVITKAPKHLIVL